MMKHSILFWMVSGLVLTSFSLTAQSSLHAVPLDTLILDAGDNVENIQWQISSDQENWEAIDGGTNSQFKWVLQNVPSYFRAVVSHQNCDPTYSLVLAVENDMSTYYWTDARAWENGQTPQEGETVTIPADQRIILNTSPPALSGLNINGELLFDDEADRSLTADWIMIHGKLQIGTVDEPFTKKAMVTLTGTDMSQSIMGMGNRGIMVMGGILDLHGVVPEVIWTKINNHAEKGSQNIELIETVDWKVGDEIVIAPTDYYRAGIGGVSITQETIITASTGNQLVIADGLNAHRWGLLQYATQDGMSLSPSNLLNPPAPDTEEKKTPLVLDERAEVGNLTRNIVIQAPDDDRWQTSGYGVHIMIMGPQSKAYLDGVAINRGGQRNRLGRYPFHWHMLSYSGSQTLEDATGQYIKNSTINGSRNRGIVIHGTNGVLVQNNIVFDVQGHGIFTEDAVERRNTIDGNLVLKIRNPPFGQALKQHETGEKGSSGFWISNPDNFITNNTAADCGSRGFWLAFTARPWGESSSVVAEDGLLLNPSRLLFGIFDQNTAHSNGREGIMLDEVEIDEDGNFFPFQYVSTTDGRNPHWPFATTRRFTLSNYAVWKNGHNGIWDRAFLPDNYGVVSAENCQRFFAGSGQDGIIERSLVVGTSLNHLMNGTDRPYFNFSNFPDGQSVGTPVAFATYHSAFDIKDNIVMNFPAVENTWSGVFSTDDYYFRPVEKGQIRNTNNLILNSHPGVKLRAFADYFTLASTMWDPHGVWGPVNNYVVYDEPFLTYGKTITQIEPSAAVAGAVSVPGPFYGFLDFVLHGVGDSPPQNQPYMDLMGLHVKRLDDQFNEVAEWNVQPAPNAFATLQHMRDFSTTPDGIYELSFSWNDPASFPPHPTDFSMAVENMLTEADVQLMSVEFEGALDPTVMLWIYNGYTVPYQQLNSLEEVVDSNGETWWQDKPNNKVWVKLRGGRWAFWTNDPAIDMPSSDELLYHTSILRIFEP